jgi:hypothetical protein
LIQEKPKKETALLGQPLFVPAQTLLSPFDKKYNSAACVLPVFELGL